MRDPYSVLGIKKGCSEHTLKRAMRLKSKKWHPDANPGRKELAEANFREIQEAYETILAERAFENSADWADPEEEEYTAPTGTYRSSYAYPERADVGKGTGQSASGERKRNEGYFGRFNDIEDMADKGEYRQAEAMLREMPNVPEAIWYYYLAYIYKEADQKKAARYVKEALYLIAPNEPGIKRIRKLYKELCKEPYAFEEIRKKTGDKKEKGQKGDPYHYAKLVALFFPPALLVALSEGEDGVATFFVILGLFSVLWGICFIAHILAKAIENAFGIEHADPESWSAKKEQTDTETKERDGQKSKKDFGTKATMAVIGFFILVVDWAVCQGFAHQSSAGMPNAVFAMASIMVIEAIVYFRVKGFFKEQPVKRPQRNRRKRKKNKSVKSRKKK